MPSMIERKCKCCGKSFMARTADVNRGWARFCSKSCKAKYQESHRRNRKNHRFRSKSVSTQKYLNYAREYGGQPQFNTRGEYIGFCDGNFSNEWNE